MMDRFYSSAVILQTKMSTRYGRAPHSKEFKVSDWMPFGMIHYQAEVPGAEIPNDGILF